MRVRDDWLIAIAAGVIVVVLVLAFIGAARAVAYPANSTAYCLSGTMADGTQVRPGSVASNSHALGTKLTITGPAAGRYVVRDRIGHGSELDVWMPSCQSAISYGRRVVDVSVGWRPKRVLVGKVMRWRHVRLPGEADPNLGTAVVCDRRGCVEAP